jgi:hypothetical protein
LKIFGVQATDTSEITCTATNVVGEATASSELMVKGTKLFCRHFYTAFPFKSCLQSVNTFIDCFTFIDW